jgi:hypothetical protein
MIACERDCRSQSGADATSCMDVCTERFPAGAFLYLDNKKCVMQACGLEDPSANWNHLEGKGEWYPWVEDCVTECTSNQVCAWIGFAHVPHPQDRCADIPPGCESDLTCECLQPCTGNHECAELTGYYACP